MKSRLFLFIINILIQNDSLLAQNLKQEIGIQTDNDSYLAGGSDRYYTNGIFIFYNKALNFDREKKNKLENKIFGIKIVQKIFTPKTININSIQEIDRPYAGFLFIEPQLNLLFKNESSIKLSSTIGVIGNKSGAKVVQKTIHNLLGFDEPRGWENQIEDNYIINFSAEYTKLLIKESSYDLSFNGKVNLGNGFNGTELGPIIRVGKFNKLFNSMITNSSVYYNNNIKSNYHEFYFYYKPKILYNVYDATIQGNMFSKNNQEIMYTIQPIVFSNQLGVDYRIKHLSASLNITFQTTDVKRMRRDYHGWGSIVVSYLF